MMEQVIAICEEESGLTNLTAESRLDSLGLDSLDFLELIVRVERELRCKISEEAVAALETVGDLAKASA